MNPAKRNVALLVLCQALAMTTMTVLITVAALAANEMTDNKVLVTLPIALMQVAVMLATIPASMLMRQVGRRLGFMVGSGFAMVGGAIAAYAILINSFPLFSLGLFSIGIFSGFSGYYRFAAADAADESFRPQAISFVVAGGVLAALLGPGMAIASSEWFSNAMFAGTLLVVVALQIPTVLVLLGVKIPPLPVAERQKRGRSLTEIMQQPAFGVAVVGSMAGYGVMAFLMTATPLAMVAMQHPFPSAASVIQWHVLGMFAPSFFTGFLITRFGVLTMLLLGAVLNLLCVGTNLMGDSTSHFHLALTLLGVGWNFMYVSATTLLTETYTPAEKAKTQATHDFLMYTFVAFCTYLSGELLDRFGWVTLNYAAIPALVVAMASVLWLMRQRQRGLQGVHLR
ncbi:MULTISPECIES: MFS transporter [unclassified Leptolyngbya]|uniref:MFS transporter n=1 Tax=unclassified Leptolyngbya TaxID=2650499 RepID=UPI0016892B97|nr:MFS transporter [Leptolyngbya sp. FACHB-8]MBD2153289.1 MFS transporter [Leptolyngbya sp. FACHB-16]